MKKLIITLTFVSFVMISQAQLFMGGSVGYKSTSDKATRDNDEEIESYSGFSFSPLIGYQIDRFAFGGNFLLNMSTDTEKYSSRSSGWTYNREEKTQTTLWGIQPFVRYTFAEFGRFSVYANASFHLLAGTNTWKETVGYGGGGRGEITTEIKINSTGFNIVPVLSYNLSQKINLEVALDFMNFGLNTIKSEDKKSKEKHTVNDFGIGVNSGNMANVGVISVGFVYKFNSPDRCEKDRQIRREKRDERREKRDERREKRDERRAELERIFQEQQRSAPAQPQRTVQRHGAFF